MLKRVLSVALFLTLVFSLVPMANAENTVTGLGVDFVLVVPAGSEDFNYEELTAVGYPYGILIPGTKDDKITISMPHAEVIDKEFDVYVFLNGTLEENKGFVALNNYQTDFNKLTDLGNGTFAFKTTFTLVEEDDVVYPFVDFGSSKGFKVSIFQDGVATITYKFTVEYEDAAASSNYDSILYSLYSLSIDEYIDITDAVEPTDDVAIGTVTASVLNLRSGPSTGNSIIGKLPRGTEVMIVGSDNGWFEVVTADGATGFVFASFIK